MAELTFVANGMAAATCEYAIDAAGTLYCRMSGMLNGRQAVGEWSVSPGEPLTVEEFERLLRAAQRQSRGNVYWQQRTPDYDA